MMGLDPKNFERVLKNWEGINEFQKFHMEQMFADRIGVSFPKLEAYKNSFMELSVPSGGLGQLGKEPNGLGDLSDIKADHRAEGYENLKKAGFDLERFNNDSRAYSEAAKITGLMRHIKGEDLTQKELSMAGSGGLFSESGLKQAIGKVSKAVGMEEKDLNNALNHWKGVSQFMELADSQGTMNRVWGLNLPALSEYTKNFEKMAAEPAPERAGVDQSGKVSLAFTPDGKGGLEIVQQTRRAGTETKVGDFATSGHEAARLDRTTRDYQDVDRGGQLISRGTVIDEKTAFQMALQGDQSLVRPLTNSFLSDKERDSEFAVLSRTMARATSDYMSETGVSVDTFSVAGDVSLGFRLLGNGVGGRTEAAWPTTDEKNFNIMTQQYDKIIRSAHKEAKDKGLDVQGTRQLLSERLEDYTNKIYKDMRETSKWDVGAMAPLTGAMKAFKEHGEIAAQNPNIPLAKNP